MKEYHTLIWWTCILLKYDIYYSRKRGGFNKMYYCNFYKYKEMFLMILFFCYSFWRTCLNFSIVSLIFLTLSIPLFTTLHIHDLFFHPFSTILNIKWGCGTFTEELTKQQNGVGTVLCGITDEENERGNPQSMWVCVHVNVSNFTRICFGLY